MKVRLLMVEDGERYYMEVEGDQTDIPDLALTPYKYGVSVTHIATGRALNDRPLSVSRALILLSDLKAMDIPWDKLVDGDNSRLLKYSHLNERRSP